MSTSKKIDIWFWGIGTLALFETFFGDADRANSLLPIVFMALFAGYLAELIETKL
jgi:hypothetical protein